MHAEKLTLKTDASGTLQGLPELPPQTTVEVILLFSAEPASTEIESKKIRRQPLPELIGQMDILDDIIAPIASEDDWDALR